MTDNPQPLDLEDIEKKVLKELPMVVGDTYTKISEEKRIEQVIKEAIKLTKEEIKQRLKSAYDFYFLYRDKPDLLLKHHPEYNGDLILYRNKKRKLFDWERIIYNEWLFKIAFKDVLGDKE